MSEAADRLTAAAKTTDSWGRTDGLLVKLPDAMRWVEILGKRIEALERENVRLKSAMCGESANRDDAEDCEACLVIENWPCPVHFNQRVAALEQENARLVAERDVLKTDLTECYGQPHCSVMDRTSHRFQIDSARAVAEELTVENTRLTQELEAAAGDKCLHCSHGDKPQRDEDEIWRHRFGNANHRPYFCAAGPIHERRQQASEQANQPTKMQQLTRERDTLRTAIVTTIRNLVDGVSKGDILATLERVLEHGAENVTQPENAPQIEDDCR